MTDNNNEQVTQIIDSLNELSEDSTIPRNIKIKISKIINILSSEDDFFMKINKALNELDEISNDSNIQSYTRTQLWNIVSLLESI